MTDEIEVILPAPIEVVVDSGGGGSSVWGAISGAILDQVDLKDALDLKADQEATTMALGLKADQSVVEEKLDAIDLTLQNAYDNSELLVLNHGPLQFIAGALNTDPIQEFLDDAGNIRASIAGDGAASFGNKTAGNYSSFEPDGTYRMHGDATVYDDISISGMSFAPGGAAAPDIIDFVTPNLKVYGFNGGGTVERLYITSESKHEYEEGSELEFHVHWTPTTTGAGNVKWQAYVSWMSVDGIFSAPTLLTGVSPARGQAWQNTYITLGTIPGAGMTINSQLVIQIFRDPGDAQDTYASDAAFIAFGIHYKKDTVGSRTRTAK